MSNAEKTFSAIITSAIVVAGLAVVVPGLVVLGGFTYQQLWNWFLVPLGAPALSLPHAVGISCIVAMLKPARQSDKDDPTKNLREGILLCSIVLAVGYVAKQWM